MAIPGVRPRFLAPGDKLGKFELIRQIAVGGMAELYLARTMGIEGFEKLVVVKRILPQFAANQQFVAMFLNEARLSATLHHPNIAQVYDIGVEDGDYFFSMEYIHGEDLGRLHATGIENGVPMSLDAALTLVAGLCAGLHYAHTKAGPDGRRLEIVHRDVSPSNVLVSYDGAVKLVDFGIARASGTPATTRGGLKGKIAYMSPEQCRGDATLDRRSDIFSIGTILYELTTGRLPFLEENEYAVLNNIVNVDAPRPSTIVPSYAPALEAIVLKALARDPAQRFGSALELQKEIEDFAHENRLRVSPLVLARLMSTLFPARLEEWDQARAQGAFFVEQHVVRTLVESGKTQVEEPLAQLPLTPMAPVIPLTPPAPVGPSADDEATDIVTALPPPKRTEKSSRSDENAFGPDMGTLPGQGPMVVRTLPRAPTPSPRQPTPPAALPRASSPAMRAPTPTPPVPMPRPPTPTPVAPHIVAAAIAPDVSDVQAMHAAPEAASDAHAFGAPSAGTLVSNPAVDSVPVAATPSADFTERVRSRNDETAFVRVDRKSRAPVFIGIGLLLAGAGIAAFIAFGGSDATAPRAKTGESTRPAPDRMPVIDPDEAKPNATPDEAMSEATPDEATEPASVEPSEAVEPTVGEQELAPKIELAVEPDPAIETEPVETPKQKATKKASPKKTTKKAVDKPAPKKAEPKKTEPKAEPKKESEWNADSPFMPVRQ